MAATAACETTYRAAAKTITETTGLSISPQGVWNIVQKLGEQQKARVARHAELAQRGQGAGVLETKLLYEENDGIWLKLQGKDRKQYVPRRALDAVRKNEAPDTGQQGRLRDL